jgi:hypothetical protein
LCNNFGSLGFGGVSPRQIPDQFFYLIGTLKTFHNIRFEKFVAKIIAEWQNNAKLKKGPYALK